MRAFLIFFLLVTFGCGKKERPEAQRALAAKPEWIFRLKNESHFSLESPKSQIREKYPWELRSVGNHPRITKEYFRCKGNSLNPLKTSTNRLDQIVYLFDCGGRETHSLPIKGNGEFIYPILIELLNFIQEKTGQRVVITCGHRCPNHNQYVDMELQNQTSKHQIGAEVDFYIEGMESEPHKAIELIMQYYQTQPEYEGRAEYCYFKRYEKPTDVSTLPWYNREIYVKIYKSHEGRDLDNNHSFPYISIQVTYDKAENKQVSYSWHSAYNGYRRS